LVQFFYSSITSSIRGGYLRFIYQYISQIPIPPATPSQEAEIEALVARILALKRADAQADTSAEEQEVDRLVYGLYGLTEEEVGVVGGSS
jgi:hypothetical protein